MQAQQKLLDNLRHLDSWGALAIGEDSSLRKLVTGRDAGVQVRAVDGKEARDHDAFMKALWKPLELPYYFGENWSAFDEVIHDMEWLQASAYIIVILNSSEVLETGEDDFKILLELLEGAHRDWKNPEDDGFGADWTNEPKDMFFLFQVTPDSKEAMVKRLRGADVRLPVVELNSLVPE